MRSEYRVLFAEHSMTTPYGSFLIEIGMQLYFALRVLREFKPRNGRAVPIESKPGSQSRKYTRRSSV